MVCELREGGAVLLLLEYVLLRLSLSAEALAEARENVCPGGTGTGEWMRGDFYFINK